MIEKSIDKFRKLEKLMNDDVIDVKSDGRIIMDLSGNQWAMERMKPGQGEAEGYHRLGKEMGCPPFSWIPAQVPGDVHTDLFLAGEIEDPVVGRNMGKVKWVNEYEWWYVHAFNMNDNMKDKQLSLFFGGVDYDCDVWLNGQYLGHHEGMLTSFQFDVSKIIDFDKRNGVHNQLAVRINPTNTNQKNFVGLRVNNIGDYLVDVMPMGIWQPVQLIATDKVYIDNYRLESVIKGTSAEVTIDVEMTGHNDGKNNMDLVIELSDENDKFVCEKSVRICRGINKYSIEMTMEDVKLWWPYDLGEAHLYDIHIYLKQSGVLCDELVEKVGIRTINMSMNPGFTEEESEIPWTFEINGKSMFLRSACWGGPPSIFYGRNDEERYRYFLEKAKEANINNLRIFGWHPPETKIFYDICDELGMTVWTNFPMASITFEQNHVYIMKVLDSCKNVVMDRRNHPSNIFWMGGEEVYFHSEHVESGNKALMQKIGYITSENTNVPYADASPLSTDEGLRLGYGTKESMHANSHYYGAGALFMEDYYPELDCAIIPELTAASAPNVESLKKFIPEDELWPFGLSWGYHAATLSILERLNYEVFGDTRKDSLESFVKSTQIAHGTILQYSLELYRRRKPHVSGVALCHFITNWPLAKWEIIDYYGVEKEAFYFVKKAYEPLLPSLEFEKRRWLPGDKFNPNIWIINDYYDEYSNISLEIFITNEDGKEMYKDQVIVNVEPNSSEKKIGVDWEVKGNVGETFKVTLKLIDDVTELIVNDYTFLVSDQLIAKEEGMKLKKEADQLAANYGRSYYNYYEDGNHPKWI